MEIKDCISTILIYTTIILYSCEIKQIDTNNITNKTDSIKHEPFKGIGELIVDTPFEKVSNYKKFNKNGNIYSLEKYEISKEIGVVEFVEVEVYKGLIYKVSFCNGPFTNNFPQLSFDSTKFQDNEEYGYSFNNDFLTFSKRKLTYAQMKFLKSQPKPKILNGENQTWYSTSNGQLLSISSNDLNKLSQQSLYSYESIIIEAKIKQYSDSLNKVQYMQDVVK